LNWHEMFYKEGADGLLFFLELKERIRAEFSPDFLLIDARTGITEIGGVATTLLPDQVVCLLLNNRENLEGAREVLRGITRASQQRNKSIGIVPVLARLPGLPRRVDSDLERRITEGVRAFLCAGTDDQTPAIDLPAVSVLHAEESLAFQESLRIGSTKTVDESPLLRDYHRLLAQIITKERVEPHLDRLVGSAMKELLEKPDRVQSDLEALATYCPHPTSYLALLKFYRLRNAPSGKMLQTAVRYWELSRRSDQPLLRDIVSEHFKPERRPREDSIPMLAEFVEAVWDAQGGNDPDVGLRLVDQFLMQRSKDRAVRVVEQLLRAPDGNPQIVIGCISRLIEAEEYQQAQAAVDQWVTTLADNPEFQSVWASLVVKQRDSSAAKRLFESKDFRPASILAKRPQVYVHLLMLAGRKEELEAALQNSLDQSIASGDVDQMMQTARLFDDLGRLDVLKSRIKESLPRQRAERILDMLPHQRGRIMRHVIPGDEMMF
ncbi:MAG: tetratricopeptide repeat protein, partial [Isosphaerales bacterium]